MTETDRPAPRGAVYFADLSPAVGSEQRGFRPVLVLPAGFGCARSPTVVAVPLSTRLKKLHLPCHVLLSESRCLQKNSVALVEQIRVLDRSRLRVFLGCVSEDDLQNVRRALRECFCSEAPFPPAPDACRTAFPS